MALSTHRNTEDWLLLASGDDAAFKRLYNHYNSAIYTIAIKILKDAFLAEEIVQDVFVALWEVRARIGEWDRPEGVLYTMAKNRTLNCLKIKARQALHTIEKTHLEQAGTDDAAARRILDYENALLFQRLLNSLSNQEKKVFLLSRVEGYSYKEIASLLNVSDQTIKSQITAALRKIRLSLADGKLLVMLLTYILF